MCIRDRDVIVNDVFVDPGNPDHVLLATDRGGVLLSNDAGASFVPANDGFSARKVEALVASSMNQPAGDVYKRQPPRAGIQLRPA